MKPVLLALALCVVSATAVRAADAVASAPDQSGAASGCLAPAMPVKGATTVQRKAFNAAADVYVGCVNNFLEAQRATAKAAVDKVAVQAALDRSAAATRTYKAWVAQIQAYETAELAAAAKRKAPETISYSYKPDGPDGGGVGDARGGDSGSGGSATKTDQPR